MNGRNGKILVLTTDAKEKPLKWLDYMLRSARGILSEDVEIVICTDAPEKVGSVVSDSGLPNEVDIHDVTETMERLGLSRLAELSFHGVTISPLQMYRLALPADPRFSRYEKVVFSDVDVGFESVEWNRIFDEPCDDVDALAVFDCKLNPRAVNARCEELEKTRVFDTVESSIKERIRNRVYYAAGLLVMNLERLRTAHGDYNEFLRKMVDVCIAEKLPQLDQSLVNLYWDVREIAPSYNAWVSNSSVGMPVWMRHFPGPQKVRENYYPPRGRYIPPKKVDILYTVGNPSQHDDQELRWSLRSIAKYGRNVGRVIVVSPCRREWLSDEVVQLVCPDIPQVGYKHHNILNSILFAVDELGLDDEFSVSSDDHFYVRETDFSNQPFVARDWTIPHESGASMSLSTMIWRQSCVDTREFLLKRGLPTINFQMHRNAKWHGSLVTDCRKIFTEAMLLRFCVEPHVLMQNLWIARQPDIPIVFGRDAKIKDFRGIDGIDCISCYDQTFVDPPFIDFMEGEFGQPCVYERQA